MVGVNDSYLHAGSTGSRSWYMGSAQTSLQASGINRYIACTHSINTYYTKKRNVFSHCYVQLLLCLPPEALVINGVDCKKCRRNRKRRPLQKRKRTTTQTDLTHKDSSKTNTPQHLIRQTATEPPLMSTYNEASCCSVW